MRVLVLSGSGLSADSGLPTFRGAGGVYEGMRAEAFLSAETYANDPEAVEAWLDGLRVAGMDAEPNAAHRALAAYQTRHPETLLLTQNVDVLLERAGAHDVVHLHGRLDRLRCLGHAHPVALGPGGRADAPARCPRCGARLRSDVVLFGEAAPEYATLRRVLRAARASDALVVVGTQGGVLPVDDIVRAFPGRTLLSNLHDSPHLDAARFTAVVPGRAAEVMDAVLAQVEAWRAAGPDDGEP